MKRFLARMGMLVTLCGFDRLVFRGWLIPLIIERGMYTFLKRAGIRLLDFREFVLSTSNRLKEASLEEAVKNDRPIHFVASSHVDKEDLARTLLAAHPIKQGLVCVIKALEPCMSFEYHRSKDLNERGLKRGPSKCLYIYKYFLHPTFGFMNARIQTWFPFDIQICLNGREWLAWQFKGAGCTKFRRSDNCFTWLGDPELAQRLMNEQLRTDWPSALGKIARSLNPLHVDMFKPWPMDYYWSTYQSEWASDILFKDQRSLAAVYPTLVRHAVHHFKSADVMRFLGRKDKARENFKGDLVTSFKDRIEGVRVKHWVSGNSIKMYDKAGTVLRVETTIAQPEGFKVFRPLTGKPDGKLAWKPLRKGIADLHRLAQVSQRSNDNYLAALAAVEDTTPCSQLFDAVSRPVVDGPRRVRALRLGDPTDIALLQAISRGEFATAGFRNRDLRRLLNPGAIDAPPEEVRRLSSRVSRQLRILRIQGVIAKVQKTHRYRLTARGRLLTAALFATREANIKQLIAKTA